MNRFRSFRLLALLGIFCLWIVRILPVQAQSLSEQQQTIVALEQQIQFLKIMQTQQALEATLAALNSNTWAATPQPPTGQSGMMNWNGANSPYFPTTTPLPPAQPPQGYPQQHPAYIRPPAVMEPPLRWNKPASRFKTEIYVGEGQSYENIADALKGIPKNAGEVILYLTSDTEEPQEMEIPFGIGITSLQIESVNENTFVAYPKGRSFWFFCNGVPFILGSKVEFFGKSMVMGGAITYARHNVQVPSSVIIINGSAWWIYAGGQSDRVGHSSTVDNALVIVNGYVDRVLAGGRSIYGETFVHQSTVVVNGKANEVYCSGYTEYSNARATVGVASMKIYGWYGKYGIGLGQGEVILQNPTGCY